MITYYNDHVRVPLPPRHRFPMAKYGMLHRRLLEEGILRPSQLLPSPALERAQLIQAHAPDYVDAFLEGRLDRRAQRAIGLPWSPALVERVRTSMGGTLHAALHAMDTSISGNLAGGTHHAHRTHGGGFCVFNDLAIAALTLLHQGILQRAAIVDLDVHHGDGSATLLASTPEIFTLSLHGQKNYPFHKPPGDLDVGLPDGCDDLTYLNALEEALDAVWNHAPELILYQAGVDPLQADSLGRLDLSLDGLRQRDLMVLAGAHARGIPVALTLGGGYAHPIELTVEAYAQTYQVARQVYGR
ncbi:histone deacetylase [Lujinxingia litoralis]|uniref:Histone deacetylase n=1 Tax=Lujinxingia litoralis TaxID=2211119 RepID=A0A328CDE3_9DELT|nr:histone deacetylase [Lujinxingia litoralis]RAL24663.1 histone deacetylase [Lujinxingia litoralis]